MESIFEIIQQKPAYFAWAFAIVNLLWGSFLYFNRKRHAEEIERLKQSLNLDLERRRKVFEMKATQYEAYFNNIDAFHRKHQNDYHEVFVPLFNEFNRRYSTAENNNDTAASTEATIWFSNEIQKITINGFHEQQALEQQTNSLKLTASNEVAALLDELKRLNSQIFEVSCEQLKKLVEITIRNDQSAVQQMQLVLAKLGEEIKTKSQELREEMRRDLLEI